MLARIALALGLALGLPGCASAIASALGATGSSASAAADLDAAMASAALSGLASGGEARTTPHTAPDATSFGGEPAFVCVIPGEDETQTLAASSLDGAVATCGAMNAMPEGARCTCREADLGSALGGPIAER